MPTIEEQLALRDRLQAAEDDLVASGKQRVTLDGAQGIFTWARHGVHTKQAEPIVMNHIQEIEDMIVAQEWADIIVATDHGTWMWRPR